MELLCEFLRRLIPEQRLILDTGAIRLDVVKTAIKMVRGNFLVRLDIGFLLVLES